MNMINNLKEKCLDAKFHAHEIELALELFYWTGDEFHYQEALSHFDTFVSEMAKLQNIKGGKNEKIS